MIVLLAQDLLNVEGTQIFKHRWGATSAFREGAQKAAEQCLCGTGERAAQATVPTGSVSPGLPADLEKTV